MIIRKTSAIGIAMSIFYLAMSLPVLRGRSSELWLLGSLFLVLSIYAVYMTMVNKQLEKNLIPAFAFCFYFIYMTMSQAYMMNSPRVTTSDCTNTSIVCTGSLLLLIISVSSARRIRSKKFKFLDLEPRIFTYYVLLILALFVHFLEIMAAGGIVAYFSSGYQEKYASAAIEKVLGGIGKVISPFQYYNLFYVTGNRKSTVTLVSRIYFVLNLLLTYASGASLSILYQLIALCCVQIFGKDSSVKKLKEDQKKKKIRKNQKKWITIGIFLGCIGIIAAILIRFNRSADNFSFAVLNDVYQYLISTSTFDALYYLSLTIDKLTPQYSLGQLLFPVVFWVPRSLFPWKPVELGRIVALTFKNYRADVNGGYAVTPMAEFYYDMGILGMIAGVFMLGWLIAFLQKKLNHSRDCKYKIVVTMMFMFPMISLSTSWASLGSSIVATGMFLWMTTILNRCKFGE